MVDVANENDITVPLELLAPAGDLAALEAALAAGADAVYFGLSSLNARRRAKNFRQDEFVQAVETVHARGAKAYVTLNIDLSERDIGEAARILELARQCRVDGVLVRDPAILALVGAYPELEFHFSTQTCMASSADVNAARELGARRVVLAREMTLAEIAAASAVPSIETEVFVQGALCFSISGRCLLASWVGGRSGNRGTCTSPCRVPWMVGEQPAGNPLSMHDLSLIERLGDLAKAGVRALKIEGRLKSAAWVGQAVSLYRQALSGEDPKRLAEEAAALGAYTGREMTSGYLSGDRDNLTGESGRIASSVQPPEADLPRRAEQEAPITEDSASVQALPDEEEAKGPTYELHMTVGPRAVDCRVLCGQRTVEWSIPKSVVRRKHKASTIGQLLTWLGMQTIQGCRLTRSSTNEPDFLLVPRAVNAMVDRISAAARLGRKAPDTHVRIALPQGVSDIVAKQTKFSANRLRLGDKPDRVRLDASQVQGFFKEARSAGVIVESLAAANVKRIVAAARRSEVIVALPQVFFEDELPAIRELVEACVEAEVTVEVNSWGGWWLARQAGARMESGPGLPVLNGLAARRLREAKIQCVTLSIEAERRQLEELTAVCPVPCSLVVFGRPALATSRVRLPREQFAGRTVSDRRGMQLTPRLERGLWVFRPVDPFDLRASKNELIRVRHLVVDLVGSDDPVGDWLNIPVDNEETFRFNYDRSLE